MEKFDKSRLVDESGALQTFNERVAAEFRANRGVVGGVLANNQHLLLHTTGAKSGRPRMSPLAYRIIDEKLVITGAYAGAPKDPAWTHNLRARPHARIEIGPETYDVLAREILGDERTSMYVEIARLSTEFEKFQESAGRRAIPLFELRRTTR